MDTQANEAKKADVASDGSVNEQSLALSWSIPRSTLSAVRKGHLREHWHWKIGPSGNSGDIRITREGVEELKKWVVPPQKVVPPEPPPEVLVSVKPREVLPFSQTVVVVDRVPPNPRMLLCRDSAGEAVSVRVRSNVLFHRGMKIDLELQCRRLADEPTVSGGHKRPIYIFYGKYPRGYGRW